MELWEIILICLAAALGLGIIMTFVISYIIYRVLLVRTSDKKWDRNCSAPEEAEPVEMHRIGAIWAAEHAANKKELELTNEGFRLYGEYYDLGYDKAVIIVGGRMESLTYGYYFAKPFCESGYNILVIDNRAHGLSDGRYNCLGHREYSDLLAWAKLLHDEQAISSVVFHGICIGSSTALFALADKNCPDYIDGMVAEGMYDTFFNSFKYHMIDQGRPIFPFLWETMLFIRIFSHANVMTDGPKKRIKLLKKPILFLHSRTDKYSKPEQAEYLFANCDAKKRLVWFDDCAHSRIRINHTDKYDNAIKDFLAEL